MLVVMRAIMARRPAAVAASWPAASSVVVCSALVVTAVSPWTMWAEPVATLVTLRAMSLVVTVCSGTAAAIVVWMSFMREMTSAMRSMAPTADWVSVWMAWTRAVMLSVARVAGATREPGSSAG